jgi:hypothetical protein
LDIDIVDKNGNPPPLISAWLPKIKGVKLPALVVVDQSTETIVDKIEMNNYEYSSLVATVKKYGD